MESTPAHGAGARGAAAGANAPAAVLPRLGLWDAVSIIVGIVVGTAIFRSSPLVFQNVAGPWHALGVWLLGGVLCVFGAFCYAELATAYPRNGGDYEYLSRAFGRPVGFLFGWAQLTVVLTGSIGAMAYAFADYGEGLWGLSAGSKAWIAAAVIVALSVTNLAGVIVGKWLQNILSIAKILGLGGVVFAGLVWGRDPALAETAKAIGPMAGPGLGLALVFVLYAFGGWNDAAFVAAEVRDQKRNLPRALLIGIAGITVVYLLVNAAYLTVLGFQEARDTMTPAADVMRRALGPWGAKAISVLVMVSALGAINGMILTGARVYATVGEDHALFAALGRWNRKRGAPVAAIAAQALIALLLVVAVGTENGRAAIDACLRMLGVGALPWERYFGGFETLVAGTAPVFWSFFLLTGLALFVLRLKDPGRERPFPTPWFPLPPLVFSATCVYMLYSSLDYARWLALLGGAPIAVGAAVYCIQRCGSSGDSH
jgi:basic amino acid/polyamine antiporter, APA family